MSALDIVLEIALEPKPKNRLKLGVNRKTKRVMAFRDKSMHEWSAAFAAIASAKLPAAIIDEPVRVDIMSVLPRPKKLDSKKNPDGLVWHVSRPDRDNLIKAVQDALRAFWRDDSLICVGTSLKVYAERTGRPRTVVRIRSASVLDPEATARELGLLAEVTR
jgi:Holliday junction resolvase RusA-like endonuclease